MSVCRLHIIVSRYLNRNGNNGGNRYIHSNPFPDLFYVILSLNFATHHYTSTYTDFVTVHGTKVTMDCRWKLNCNDVNHVHRVRCKKIRWLCNSRHVLLPTYGLPECTLHCELHYNCTRNNATLVRGWEAWGGGVAAYIRPSQRSWCCLVIISYNS